MQPKAVLPVAEGLRYLVVSPVKDEATHVRRTLDSMVRQTVAPLRWIIVDDGSTDETPQILREYAARHDWIELVRVERDSKRELGITEIKAFALGFERVRAIESDFVVKLDCDLDLPADYFERMFARFAENPKLGIASGVYLEKAIEPTGEQWLPVKMPEYHAAGASKIVRRKCFDEIDGFILYRGWDTVDEIKAQMRGWETAHFPEITFKHLKKEGSAMGAARTHIFHGEIYYLTGGGFLFFLLKCAHRAMTGSPRLLGGLGMFWGYLKCRLTGRKRPISDGEARFYARMLNRRLLGQLRGQN